MKSNTNNQQRLSDNSATNSPTSDSGGKRSPKFTLPEMICKRDKFKYHSVDQRSFTMKIVEGIDVTSQAAVTANMQK